MKLNHRFFLWILPTVWVMIAAIGFRYAGDEYGLWGVGSLAGTWLFGIFRSFHSGSSPSALLPPVLIAGFATMALLGYFLDRLRTPRIPLIITWLAVTGLLVAYLLNQYPTLERAVAKNGSILAYVLSAANFSLLAITLLFLTFVATRAGIRRVRGTNAQPQHA